MADAKNQPQSFATADEAARKARDDLVAVLRGPAKLNAGVDAATVERSQPGKPVRRVDVSFEKLLSMQSVSTFDALVAGEQSTVMPLLVGDDVVTIVEVRRDGSAWRIVGLGGKDIADDLNIVEKVSNDGDSTITLYEIPNLQARVYGVKANGAERLFTNYGERFSLRGGVDAASLAPVLRSDAIAFQAKFGERLKTERLLR